MTQRLAFVRVSHPMLADFLKGRQHYWGADDLETTTSLPDDATVVCISDDPVTRTVRILFASASFAEVAEPDEVPEFVVTITTRRRDVVAA